jgi:hypothetical protein
MAFVFTPTCPGTGPWYIDREDCIGDSLVFINANTGYFDCKIDSLSANTSTQINNLSTVPYTRLNDGNQTGNAPIFGARAWGRFNGDVANGLITPLDSGNILSINKVGLGIYTVTFAIPMSTPNYAVTGTIAHKGGITRSVNMDIVNQTTTSFNINTGYGTSLYNSGNVQFAVFC